MPFEATAGRIVIRDVAGRDVLDTDLDTMHVTGYLQGSTTLPTLGLPNLPSFVGAVDPTYSVTLGSANSATVLGGQWRLSNAEGLALGEIEYMRDEEHIQTGPFATTRYRRRHKYAPRLQQGEWFPIGGPSMLDMYQFLFSVNPYTVTTQGTLVPEVGRLWHTIQFVIDGGSVKLLRRGRNIAHEYTYLYFPPGFIAPEAYSYNYAFDCAALTIDYRIWLGRFT